MRAYSSFLDYAGNWCLKGGLSTDGNPFRAYKKVSSVVKLMSVPFSSPTPYFKRTSQRQWRCPNTLLAGISYVPSELGISGGAALPTRPDSALKHRLGPRRQMQTPPSGLQNSRFSTTATIYIMRTAALGQTSRRLAWFRLRVWLRRRFSGEMRVWWCNPQASWAILMPLIRGF